MGVALGLRVGVVAGASETESEQNDRDVLHFSQKNEQNADALPKLQRNAGAR